MSRGEGAVGVGLDVDGDVSVEVVELVGVDCVLDAVLVVEIVDVATFSTDITEGPPGIWLPLSATPRAPSNFSARSQGG